MLDSQSSSGWHHLYTFLWRVYASIQPSLSTLAVNPQASPLPYDFSTRELKKYSLAQASPSLSPYILVDLQGDLLTFTNLSTRTICLNGHT